MRVLQKNIIILHLLVDSTEHCIKAEKPKKMCNCLRRYDIIA